MSAPSQTDAIIRTVARDLHRHLTTGQLEDGFDLTGPELPRDQASVAANLLKDRRSVISGVAATNSHRNSHHHRHSSAPMYMQKWNTTQPNVQDGPTSLHEHNVMMKLQREMGKLQVRDQDNGVYVGRPRSATHGSHSSLRNNVSPRLTPGEAHRLMGLASKLIAASETVSVIPTNQSRKLRASRVPASVAQLQRGAAKVQKAMVLSLEEDATDAGGLRGSEAAAGLHSSSQSSLSSVSTTATSRVERHKTHETYPRGTQLKSPSQISVASSTCSTSSQRRRQKSSGSGGLSLTVPTLASLRYGKNPMVQSDTAVARRPRSASSLSQSRELLHPSLVRSPYASSLQQSTSHPRRHTAGSNLSLNQRTATHAKAQQVWIQPASPAKHSAVYDMSTQTTGDQADLEQSAMATVAVDVEDEVAISGGAGLRSFSRDGKPLRSIATQTANHKGTQTSGPDPNGEDEPLPSESTVRKPKRPHAVLVQEATMLLKQLEAMVQYEVDIYTTDELPSDGKGTALSIALCGVSADSGFLPLEEEVKDGSDEALDVRTFRFHCEDVGAIRSVKLQHEGQQQDDVWQPEKVVVRQLPEGNISYVFSCSRHLYRKLGESGEHTLKHTETAMHSPHVQYLSQPGQGLISPRDTVPGQVIMTPNGPMAWLPPPPPAVPTPALSYPPGGPSVLPYPPESNSGFPMVGFPSQPQSTSQPSEPHRNPVVQDLTIHEAITEGKTKHVREMLQSSSHWLNIPNESGLLPIHCAAAQGQVECLKLCLAMHNTDLEVATPTGFTAMHLAALHGHVRCLKLLGAHGCRVNSRAVDSQTPLHLAATSGHLECCKWLVANRAKLSSNDIHRRKPLKMAKDNDHEEVVQFLKSCKEQLSDANSALSLLCTPSRKSSRSSRSRQQSGEAVQQPEEIEYINDMTERTAGKWDSDEERPETTDLQPVHQGSALDEHSMEERQAYHKEHQEKMTTNDKTFLEMIQQEVEVELNADQN